MKINNEYFNATMLDGRHAMLRICLQCGLMYETSCTGNVITQCPSQACNKARSRWGPYVQMAAGVVGFVLAKCQLCGAYIEPKDFLLHAERCK